MPKGVIWWPWPARRWPITWPTTAWARARPEVDIKVVLRADGALVLRIRDNGRAFNPLDYDLEAGDSLGCIGIKLVRSLIADLEYQNVLGLNNTVATLKP